MSLSHSLVTLLVASFVLAFALGLAANRLRLSPLVGYMAAGVLIGPHTPGFLANQNLAGQLAEVGVILLMFGVGLHFSPRELLDVRRLAVPGALAQIALATLAGGLLGLALGLPPAEAGYLGFSVSVASTVVLARALEERGEIRSPAGHLAVGWLIVQDLIMIVALVLLPLAAAPGEGGLLAGAGLAVLKVAGFLALIYVVGTRLVPAALIALAHERSRELFTLGVLATAMGIAWLAYFVFGASFALGAFVAGMVLAASPLGHAAAERSLPLRDAFAVLFFVAVGIEFDPGILRDRPLAVAGLLLVILGGGSLAALAVARAGGLPRADALRLGASLSQAGEFSFILAGFGLSLGLLGRDSRDLVVAAALLSIALNPLLFRLADRLRRSVP